MEKGNQKIKELKSSNPSGYDTRYIINFHKADISAQQTEYSEVLKKLNEKLAAGSISKNAYEEAVIKAAAYVRASALEDKGFSVSVQGFQKAGSKAEDEAGTSNTDIEASTGTKNNENTENKNKENKEYSKKPESVESIVSRAKVAELCERISRKISAAAEGSLLYSEKKSQTTLMEQEFSEKSSSSVQNVFRVLMNIEKAGSAEFSVQEKVAFVKKINENAKYNCDEKILALNNVLKSDSETPFLNADTRKHIINKIKLLNKVKASDFVFIPLERNKRKPAVKTEEAKQKPQPDNSSTQGNREKDREKTEILSSSLEKYKKVSKTVISIAKDENISPEEKISRILNVEISNAESSDTESNEKTIKKQLADSVTKSMVMSDKYFKFGAGTVVCLENMTMLVPSLFCFGKTDGSGRTVVYCTGNMHNSSYYSENMEGIAPLVIEISKRSVKPEYRLHNFFNDGISECRSKKLRYRQTATDGFPTVFKHKSGDNFYSVSVYMPLFSCIVNIDFKFNVELINKSSTVRRILSEVKFDRTAKK